MWAVLNPPPRQTISEWADAERYLSPEASAEPGKWSTTRAEYLRGIMDAIGDPRIHTVVVMTASQVGKTEILLNTIGRQIHRDPCPMLVVQPTLSMADAFSKDRLAPMLRDTPALRHLVTDPRSRDAANTVLHKAFPGGHVTMSGANSPASLASRPIRMVLCDEVDRYDDSAGTEGDPVSLAAARSRTFWNRKLLLTSTPTIKDTSRIAKAYAESDKREYHVKCPDCDHEQELKWAQVRWDKDEDGTHRPETAHYVCEGCGSLWDDTRRWRAVRHGRWVATGEHRGIAGFRLSSLASGWLKLREMVADFLSKKDDPEQFKTFVNTVLGEVWEEPAEKVEGSPLMARQENYGPRSIPSEVLFLTAGVDIQGDRVEVQTLGWGLREECWVVDYEIIRGDPSQAQLWIDLDRQLLKVYQSENGRELRVKASCIDTGGHHQHEVLTFCATRRARRVFPIKGADGPRPVWPKRHSTTKTNQTLFLVGVDTAKDVVYGRMRIGTPGPGYIHFPLGDAFDQEYFDQLTSERVVTRKRHGRPYRQWVLPERMRNEALDTFVYALAARHSIPIRLGTLGHDEEQDRAAAPAAPPARTPEPAANVPPAPRSPTGPRRVAARSRVMRSNYMG